MDTPEYFIGTLSGTSMDGVDCALVDFTTSPPRLAGRHSHPIPVALRKTLLQLCGNSQLDLTLLGEADVRMGQLFAEAVTQLLQDNNLEAGQVRAIGSHGQTVYHQPTGSAPFTLQIGDPNTIAWHTGVSTVADFRRKDMAAGGQGAPLAPMFHQAAFSSAQMRRAVVNIGGIANVSLLSRGHGESLLGFDTGPGNVLLDSWIQACREQPYDRDGAWARQGRTHEPLLEALLQEPYLSLPPPKSTGRELFNPDWLQSRLTGIPGLREEDVQATLLTFTARSISDGIRATGRDVDELLVCGGGACNRALMECLRALQAPGRVLSTEEPGLAPEWVEAVAFAWYARQAWHRRAVDCRSVTGASQPCLMGGIYFSEQ